MSTGVSGGQGVSKPEKGIIWERMWKMGRRDREIEPLLMATARNRAGSVLTFNYTPGQP